LKGFVWKKASFTQGLNPWIPRDRWVFNPLSHVDLLLRSPVVCASCHEGQTWKTGNNKGKRL
jgi:hypothetical protein